MSTVDPLVHSSPADAADWPVVLDGELMRAGEAMIPAGDDGLIRGDGAFDAFPLLAGRPFARAAHLDRLERSCSALDLPCPREQIESDIDLLLERAPEGYAVIRVVLTRGGHRICRLESRGDPAELAKPVRLLPITYDPSVLLNGVKSLSYGANMLASRRALSAGYDEALLVRSDGIVLEGPTCSIFWVRDGCLQTPAIETGILASITRRVILESMAVEEGRFSLEHVAGADEAFLASTARLGQPIIAIGEVILPAAPGPHTLRAQEAIARAMAEGSIA
ncbi:MAG: aminotransferase class IV family protein [Solirubrobacterales bacterium]|nr:aminotransferase class IV family protein [Solirubrobacterales bacterium]